MTRLSGVVLAAALVAEVVAAVVVAFGLLLGAPGVVVLSLIPAAGGLAPIVDEAVGFSRAVATLLAAARASLAGGDKR